MHLLYSLGITLRHRFPSQTSFSRYHNIGRCACLTWPEPCTLPFSVDILPATLYLHRAASALSMPWAPVLHRFNLSFCYVVCCAHLYPIFLLNTLALPVALHFVHFCSVAGSGGFLLVSVCYIIPACPSLWFDFWFWLSLLI